MRIVLLHDDIAPGAREDELDVFVQAEAIEAALDDLGHTHERLPFGLNLAAVADRLRAAHPDVVFNLVEAVGGHSRLLHLAPALLDALGLPYTGSHTEALFLTTGKLLAKRQLAAAGLPTPPWVEAIRNPESKIQNAEARRCAPGSERYILKPVWEEASVGIDDDAIIEVASQEELRRALRTRAERLGTEVFAELFIDGREFNLSVLAGSDGPAVLPPAEIHFVGYGADRPRLVGYRAKWDAASYEYHHTPRSFEFPPEDAALLTELRRLCVECWRLFDLRGYVRVDFRVDAAGRPYILEINANPCLSPDAGFAAALAQADLPFARAIERILADAGPRITAGRPGAASGLCARRCGAECHGREAREPPIHLRDTVSAADADAVREIVASTGFFHDHEIAVAVELVEENLARGAEVSGYHFLFADTADASAGTSPARTVGYACYGPIACATGSYDLYWIAVHEDYRRHGLGRVLLRAAEERIAAAGGRKVYIETSGRPQYRPTQAFYERCGYTCEAVLKDFYAPGDDKLIYVRTLG